MRNSNHPGIKIAGFLILLVICTCILNHLLVPLSSIKQKFLRYQYRDKKNIDCLIVGDSLENDGIIKAQQIIEEELGQRPFVFAVQGGYPELYIDLLADVLHDNDVTTLIAGWDVLQNMQAEFIYPRKEEFYRALIGDGVRTGNWKLVGQSLHKLFCLNYPYTFFEWASFPEYLPEIPQVLASKRKSVEDVLANGKDEPHIDPQHLMDPKFNYESVVSKEYTTKVDESYREQLITLRDICKEKHIKFYVLSGPVPQCIIDALPYEEMANASVAMFEELGIPYINGLDTRYFDNPTKEQNFKDCFGHITGTYRESYVRSICAWIKDHQ